MNKTILSVFLIVLLSLTVSALSQQECTSDFCAGYNPLNLGGNGMPLSCVNFPAFHIENYSSLSSSLNIQHEPLYGDMDSSGIMGWVYAPDANTLHIRRIFSSLSGASYNTLSYWTTTSGMTSNYVLARYNSSGQKYIYTANSSDYLIYGVSGGSLRLIANKKYSAYGTGRTRIMVSDDGASVMGYREANANGILWNRNTDTLSNMTVSGVTSEDYETTSRGVYDDTLTYNTYFCGEATNTIVCGRYNDSLALQRTYNVSVGTITDIVRGYFAPARIGSNFYLTSAYQVRNGGSSTSNPVISAIYIYNPTGTTAASYTGSGYSNIVVGDYDKDGFNEYCFLRNTTGEVQLHCYDQAFNIIENATINISLNNIVMADFNSSQPTMGFASYEGIFYPSQGLIYPSGQTGSAPGLPTVGVTLTASGQIIPAVSYSDTSVGFVMAPFIGSVTCGNGICDSGESIFTCPADCINTTSSNQTGDICMRDSDCVTNQCDYGHCQLALGGKACTSGTTCISGNCTGGRCTKPSFWQTVDAGKTDLAGNDTNTNNLISFIFIFIIAAIFCVVGFMAHMPAVGLGLSVIWILASSVFFAMVGWLSPFLAFIIIIGIIILGVLTLLIMNAINSRG